MTYLNMTGMLYTGGGSMSSPETRGQKGFTLIEMVIAIVIAGILMLTALPAMRNWRYEQDLATLAERVISELDMARTSAQQRNKLVTISPNNAAGARDWKRGFIVYENAAYTVGRGDFQEGDDLLSQFDIADANIRFGVFPADAAGAVANDSDHDANINFLPNGMSRVISGNDEFDLDAAQGNVTIKVCRVIGGRTNTWTIVMRPSGDITKAFDDTNNNCAGF